MIDTDILKIIYGDVISGTSVKDSSLDYNGEMLEKRNEIKKEVASANGPIHLPFEWPDVPTEEEKVYFKKISEMYDNGTLGLE
jgi:hypothetical protein